MLAKVGSTSVVPGGFKSSLEGATRCTGIMEGKAEIIGRNEAKERKVVGRLPVQTGLFGARQVSEGS